MAAYLTSMLSGIHQGNKHVGEDLPVKKILYLEDDHLSYMVVKKMLEDFCDEANYKVTGAKSVREAINALENDEFDAVLVDLYLPGQDGFDLLNFRKTRANLLNIPFIVVTGFNNPEYRQKSQQFMADDFLTKPLDLKDLLKTLNVLL